MANKAKGKTKSKGASRDEFWGHLAEEIPRADIEAVNRSDKRAKFFRLYVGASVALLPIALLAILSFVPKFMETAPELVIPVSELNSPTKPLAIQSVENWLATDPAPLPGGRILSWDGVTVQQKPSVTIDPTNNQTIEKVGLQLHTLTLVAPSGSLYTASIQVGYSDIRGSKITGPPSMIPQAPNDQSQWSAMVSWPNLVPVTPEESVNQAVKAWSTAFASGDPDTLRLAVGDGASNHSYVPLVQATASDSKIEYTAAPPLADGKTPPENPSTITGKVSFAVSWQGVPVSKEATTPARLTFDVLIERADTASPIVVAWGGVGTGETLKPYQNAVIDREIKKDSVQGPTNMKDGNSSAPSDK